MKEELFITTRLPRRMFCKLVERLKLDRGMEAEAAERLKDSTDEDGKHYRIIALNAVKDIDLILEALFEED